MRTCFYTCFLLLSLSCTAQNKDLHNYHTSLPELLDSLEIPLASISVLIDKSEFTLGILYDTLVIKEYPVVLGGNPTDDKLMQGDQCTPEGEFHMISKYPHKNWSRFIWIDYPTKDSWRKHNAAKRKGEIPESAGIGGEIGIHGVPEGGDKLIDLKYNWTLGCISLKNKDVEEIYPYFSKTTIIRIQK